MARLLLYDGILGTLPDSQGWLTYSSDYSTVTFQKIGSETTTSGPTIRYTTLNTNSLTTARAGYSNYRTTSPSLVNSAFPTLSRSLGFNLSFQLRINSESHSGDDNNDGLIDRAGFSVTLLGSDRSGIELGFWSNEIWAQRGNGSGLFTHSPSERSFFSTTRWISFDLLILSNTYFLSAGGNVILQGSTRNYWDNAAVGLPYDPYEQPGFLFLGDNTSRASSSVDLASVAINTVDARTMGSNGDDALTGGSGEDVINGLGGQDRLQGGGGADVLIGGEGADWLNGGNGNDRLSGQGGADRILFDSGAAFSTTTFGIDSLIDFSSVEGDRLVLDKSSFTSLSSAAGGNLAATEFAVVSGASAAALSSARIVYDSSSGGLYYNQDGVTSGFGSGGRFASLAALAGSNPYALTYPSLSASQILVQA